MSSELALYGNLLTEIKDRIRQAQTRAALSANAEMIAMYWDIGRMIHQRQQMEGWGTGIIPRLARDIRNELPEVKGFSERNIGYMMRFFREYGEPPFLQQAAAKLQTEQMSSAIVPQIEAQLDNSAVSKLPTQLAFGLPWFHHVILIEKVKELSTRIWYMQQTIEQGWSRDTLGYNKKATPTNARERRLPTFNSACPPHNPT